MSDFIRYEFRDLDKLQKQFDPKIVETAAYSAAKRTAERARTRIRSQVRELYNVKAGEIRPAVSRVSGERYAYILRYTGRLLGLDKFGMRQRITKRKGKKRYRGITVQVKKQAGRREVQGGFAADINGLKAFKRKGDSRLPIKRLMGPSVPQMVANAAVLEDIEKFVKDEMPKQFNSALAALLEKTGGA